MFSFFKKKPKEEAPVIAPAVESVIAPPSVATPAVTAAETALLPSAPVIAEVAQAEPKRSWLSRL